jgi:DNA-binding MarR family transcriptional regulator
MSPLDSYLQTGSDDEHIASSLADADALIDALMTASRAVVGVTARCVAAVSEDVTLAQYRTLVVLASRGPQNHGVLADNLALHPSTMTRMCDRLIARDLVVRIPSPTNRREVTIALSPRGSALVDQVMAMRRQLIDELVSRLDGDARAVVVRALRDIAAGADDAG